MKQNGSKLDPARTEERETHTKFKAELIEYANTIGHKTALPEHGNHYPPYDPMILMLLRKGGDFNYDIEYAKWQLSELHRQTRFGD
jgi:hypothetical protein